MYANLNNAAETIITGNDSIVIVDNFQSIRGGRTLDVTGFAPKVIRAGHILIKETSTGNLKPMPVTGDNRTSGAATLGTLVAGTGYTNGTYENVPLTNLTNGASGAGLLATVTVAGTVVTVVAVTFSGAGYKVGDVLAIPGAFAGGTQTTQATINVATVADVAGAYSALPTGHTYEAVLIATIPTNRPFAGCMLRGTVNPNASYYSLTTILAAVKAALPLIIFRED